MLCVQLCDAVFRAFTTLRGLPIDVLVWYLDIAGLAVNAAAKYVSMGICARSHLTYFCALI
jgi:hypothetical protein